MTAPQSPASRESDPVPEAMREAVDAFEEAIRDEVRSARYVTGQYPNHAVTLRKERRHELDALIAQELSALRARAEEACDDAGAWEALYGVAVERALAAEAALTSLRAEHAAEVARAEEAEEQRDALLGAANFKPGPFRNDVSRKVILEDVAGMRPAMVEARRKAERARDDADLWTMRMLEEWPGDTPLIRLWRQRKDATKRALAAEASLSAHRAAQRSQDEEIAALKAALEDTKAAADDLAKVCLDESDNRSAGALQFISGFISDQLFAIAKPEPTDV